MQRSNLKYIAAKIQNKFLINILSLIIEEMEIIDMLLINNKIIKMLLNVS